MTRSRWYLALGCVVAAIALAIVVASLRRSSAPGPAVVSPSVELAIARAGEIDVTVPAVGRLGPSAGSQSRLAFAVSGRLASVLVTVGDRVVTGQPLAAVDTSGFVLTGRQADADVLAARAQARAAEVDRTSTRLEIDRNAVTRERRLYAAGVAALKDVQAAGAQLAADEADARGAHANVAAAQAQAQSADARAALAARDSYNAVLRAPAAGIVTALYHSVGESVDPSVAVVGLSPGTTGTVTLEVAGSDLARIAPRDLVRLRVQSTGAALAGRVRGIGGAVDPTTQSAQVIVDADVPAAFSGSAVSAQIVVARDRGIVIPQQAIVADPQSGATLVFRQTRRADGTTTFAQQSVRVIFSNNISAEVTGLHAGDKIAARGAFELLAPSAGGD